MQKKLDEVVQKIVSASLPISIFVYGSRARNDFHKSSDIEIGVIYKQENNFSRKELQKILPQDVKAYPLKLEELVECRQNTVFHKKIFLRELIESAKVIYGEDIFRSLKKPKITVVDLLMENRFCVGRAVDAIMSDRAGDKESAKEYFYKSCLFGTRCLLILDKKIFPIGYDQIYEQVKGLELGKYQKLVERAFRSREKGLYKQEDIYLNAEYLSQFIENKLLDMLTEQEILLD